MSSLGHLELTLELLSMCWVRAFSENMKHLCLCVQYELLLPGWIDTGIVFTSSVATTSEWDQMGSNRIKQLHPLDSTRLYFFCVKMPICNPFGVSTVHKYNDICIGCLNSSNGGHGISINLPNNFYFCSQSEASWDQMLLWSRGKFGIKPPLNHWKTANKSSISW